jgi:hypothetical protein
MVVRMTGQLFYHPKDILNLKFSWYGIRLAIKLPLSKSRRRGSGWMVG